jgi:phosphoglycolate phosphatase
MSPPASLVFDLDGTLSDPIVGIGRSLNHALATCGFAPLPAEAISTYVGPPLDRAFRAITGSDSPERIDALVAAYRTRYRDVGFAENVMYPGIPEALAGLRARGAVLGVCTSKRVDFAERILALFDLRAHFAFVDGGDVGIEKQSQLRALLEKRSVARDALMVGDRAVDVHAAKANGLRSVGVLWGHGSAAELEDAGADYVLDAVPQLLELASLGSR